LSWGGMASHYEVGVYLEDNEHDNESEILATMIESVANSVEN